MICGNLDYFFQIRDQRLHLHQTDLNLTVLDLYTPCLPCHLSPGQAITLPCPTQLQPKRHPSISPAQSPGNNQQQASKQQRLTRLGQDHATVCSPRKQHILTNTSIAAFCPPGAAFVPIQPFSPEEFFETSKQTAEGPAELQAFVCLACKSGLLHFVPVLAPSQPTPDSAGSDYRPAAESTRAPVSQSADHSTSTHPSTIARSGSGTGLTDHRSKSTSVRFRGRILGGDRRIKIGYTTFPVSRGCSFCCLEGPSAAQHITAKHDTIAPPPSSIFHLWT